MTQAPALIFYLLLLILPVSALVARRLPLRQVVPIMAAWVAIFAIGWFMFAYFT